MSSEERVGRRSLSKILKRGNEEGVRAFTLDSLLKEKKKEEDMDLHALEREAYEKGFEAGKKEGMEAGRKRMEELIRRFSLLVGELEEIRKDFYTQKETELVELVIAVARKVIHKEISTDRGTIQEMVRTALDRLAEGGPITVRVNPDDYQYLTSRGGDFIETLKEKGIDIEPDPSIDMGCIVEGACGEVDGRVEEALRRLEKAMMEAIK